jgi:hypothetical protein
MLTAGKLHQQAGGQHHVVLTCQVIDDGYLNTPRKRSITLITGAVCNVVC